MMIGKLNSYQRVMKGLKGKNNGLLFQAGDASDLAQKIEMVVNDRELDAELSNEGRRTAVERFNFKRMADELELFSKQRAARASDP